jgi:hypothetical protein
MIYKKNHYHFRINEEKDYCENLPKNASTENRYLGHLCYTVDFRL